MKQSHYTVRELVSKILTIENEMKQIEEALKELRDHPRHQWEFNIEKDDRLPVKLLYDQLLIKRREHAQMMNIKVCILEGGAI